MKSTIYITIISINVISYLLHISIYIYSHLISKKYLNSYKITKYTFIDNKGLPSLCFAKSLTIDLVVSCVEQMQGTHGSQKLENPKPDYNFLGIFKNNSLLEGIVRNMVTNYVLSFKNRTTFLYFVSVKIA